MNPGRQGLVSRLINGFRDHGIKWLLGKCVLVLGMVLLTPLALVLRLLGYRFVDVTVDRIGHLITEPDMLIKEALLRQRPRFCAVICAPRGKMANPAIPDLFSAHKDLVLFLTQPALCFLAQPLARHPLLLYRIGRYLAAFEHQAGYIPIVDAWHGRSPVARLTSTMQKAGVNFLREIGIPEGGWFVCVHSREGGYSPADEHLHDYRNSNIENYMEAVSAIVANGGWVIRVGDDSMRPMPPHPQTIDYAHHRARCAELDLFLFAKCRFFLGNTSGPCLVVGAFGVPMALANLAPMSMVCTYGPDDIGIPKLLYSDRQKRLLSFGEVLGTELGNWRFARLFQAADLRHIDNSAEEIRELAIEMLNRVGNDLRYSEDEETLQGKFRALLRPVHYTYGSKTRAGRDFLRRYRDLLE